MMAHSLLLLSTALVARQHCVSAFAGVIPRAMQIHHTTHITDRFSSGLYVATEVVDGGDDTPQSSHIVSIKSSNIAGMVNGRDDTDVINVDFGTDACCLVAVTGESGSGKSLLVSKAIDLVTGGKAVSSLIPPASANGEVYAEGDNASYVELTVKLHEPHLSAVSVNLQRFGIDPSILYNEEQISHDGIGQLHLKRTLSANNSSGRLKSVCRINGKHVSLKTLRQISAPLFTRVDVGVASAALGRPSSRLAILDRGVSDSLLWDCANARDVYKEAKKNKEKIMHDLESRVLPSSLQGMSNDNSGLDEEQLKLLEHWVDELDQFEIRMNRFREGILAQYNEMLSDGSSISDSGNDGIAKILQRLKKNTWQGMQNIESDDKSLFASLLELREEMKAVESQLISAHLAYETLASLTAPQSAQVALENTRKLLYDISSDESGPLFESIEKTHELLNAVESSLKDCARFIDGSSGLIPTLEKMAFTGISIEEVDGIIADWNALARKHGISPYSLPNCHVSIREELDGNVEAMKLLPEAEDNERVALNDYVSTCKELSEARQKVASLLSLSVSTVLPSLGLEGSVFQVELGLRPGGFEDPYYGLETVGVDNVDFKLLHQKNAIPDPGTKGTGGGVSTEVQRGGNIAQVGSSGEKSRVLLAIETTLPGSIGSTCNSFSNSAENMPTSDSKAPPISIIYDEIDAHVGGRAAVTMAKLLSNQSSESGSQIIAITHSASLAAIADQHIVVERGLNNESKSLPIRTYAVDGSSRSKEIARMASGDLASGEAETFAEALMRDALLQKEISAS